MTMSDWTVTITLPDDGSLTPDELIEWAGQLEDFDASVSRPRSGEVDVRLYVSDGDPMKATMTAYDAVVERIGRQPIGMETLTEDEFARRAELPTLPELMSAAEIADELGVTRQRVHALRATKAFPLPLAELRGGAVWDAAAVRKFAQGWERKPGRPAATADIVVTTTSGSIVFGEVKAYLADGGPQVRTATPKHRARKSAARSRTR